MSDYYTGRILGSLPPTCHKDPGYFYERFCFVDCRGPLVVHKDSYFGLGVKIITTGHEIDQWPTLGRMIFKGVTVEDRAWICSWAVLHNCVIHKCAVVSLGAVVNGISVPPFGVAVGNPAKVVGFMYRGVVLPYDRWLKCMIDDYQLKSEL